MKGKESGQQFVSPESLTYLKLPESIAYLSEFLDSRAKLLRFLDTLKDRLVRQTSESSEHVVVTQERIEDTEKGIKEYDDILHTSLIEGFEYCINVNRDYQPHLSVLREYAGLLFEAIEKYPELQNLLNGLYDLKNGTLNTKSAIKKILENPEVFTSTHAVYMAQKHLESFELQRVAFKERISAYKQVFCDEIRYLVEKGFLPESVLENLDRVERVQFDLSDALSTFKKSVDTRSTKSGGYFPSSHTLQVSSILMAQESRNDFLGVVFHELVHAISGMSVSSEIYQGFELPKHKKIGVELGSGVSAHNKWLNEAITELITRRLVKDCEDPQKTTELRAYTDEQDALQDMFDKGLDRKVVFEAYFENFVRTPDNPKVGAKYSKMMQEIYKVMSPKEFSRLGRIFTMKKIRRGIVEHGGVPYKDSDVVTKKALRADIMLGSVSADTAVRESFIFDLPEDVEDSKIDKIISDLELNLKIQSRIYAGDLTYNITLIEPQGRT